MFSLYNAIGFSILFSFFEAYPYVFESVYGFASWQYGLLFIAVGFGVILAVITAIWIDRTYYARQHKLAVARGQPHVDPEFRLLIGQVGAPAIPIGCVFVLSSKRR